MTTSAPAPASAGRPDLPALQQLAARARYLIVDSVAASKAGHIGGPLSAADLLVALYFHELNIDPQREDDLDRDRFILSKGHCAIGLYSVLALRGYFPIEELRTFDQGDSRLQGHPDMLLTPGVDASTGSLGQGLSLGLGMAIAAKRAQRGFHTWVMIGDGEAQEGQIWEAILAAPRLGVDNLTMILDLNGLQQYGHLPSETDRFDRGEPLGHVDVPAVLRGFGWNVVGVNGSDMQAVLGAFDELRELRGNGRPSALIATTTKGHGISWTQGVYAWHNGVPTAEQLAQAAIELEVTP